MTTTTKTHREEALAPYDLDRFVNGDIFMRHQFPMRSQPEVVYNIKRVRESIEEGDGAYVMSGEAEGWAVTYHVIHHWEDNLFVVCSVFDGPIAAGACAWIVDSVWEHEANAASTIRAWTNAMHRITDLVADDMEGNLG